MSYNAVTLQQEGAFDAEPGKTLASIWQKDAGLSADSSGNVYAETGEGFYAPGTNLSISVMKLSQTGTTLSLADWFTPFDHQFLSDHDRDLAQGVLILPSQAGPVPHELIAVGKQGTVYVMDPRQHGPPVLDLYHLGHPDRPGTDPGGRLQQRHPGLLEQYGLLHRHGLSGHGLYLKRWFVDGAAPRVRKTVWRRTRPDHRQWGQRRHPLVHRAGPARHGCSHPRNHLPERPGGQWS